MSEFLAIDKQFSDNHDCSLDILKIILLPASVCEDEEVSFHQGPPEMPLGVSLLPLLILTWQRQRKKTKAGLDRIGNVLHCEFR